MFENLPTLLLAVFAGMGLLFGIVVFFWALAVLLKGATRSGAEEEQELRQQAALAAVAVALALQAEARRTAFSLPPPVLVSTWQAVQRARLLSRGRWRRGG